jgi:hypothetical protein
MLSQTTEQRRLAGLQHVPLLFIQPLARGAVRRRKGLVPHRLSLHREASFNLRLRLEHRRMFCSRAEPLLHLQVLLLMHTILPAGFNPADQVISHAPLNPSLTPDHFHEGGE